MGKRRPRRLRVGRMAAVVILLLDVIGTIVAWNFTQEQELQLARDRFDAHVERTNLAIRKRLLDHELVLRGGVGHFRGSHTVDRDEWRDYVTTLKLEENFPGIQGVGYAKWIRPEEKDSFVAKIRAEGYPNFHIWPAGERSVYTSIIYLEPFVQRNLRAFGYDMLSETVRRRAMSMAVDSGAPTISGKVRLVQETETDIQHGILMYVPFYRRNAPAETTEERWAALEGFVYSPYRMNDLMRGILGDSIRDIDLEIFDGREMNGTTLLYDADHCFGRQDTGRPPLFVSTVHINAYGREWSVHYASLPAFDATLDRTQSLMVLFVGLAITLILGAHLVHEGRQAARFERLTAILESTPDIVAIADPKGNALYMNAAGRELLGVGWDENVRKYHMRQFHPPELDAQFVGEILPAVSRRGFWRGEIEFRSLGGRSIPTLMVLVAHRNGTGDIEYYSTISRDMTEGRAAADREQRLQQRLRQADKMAAVGQFVAGIAHEINNPLTGILGYAELIRHSRSMSGVRSDIDMIEKEAARCARVVQNLLTFARKWEPARLNCDLNGVMNDTLELMKHQFKIENVSIETGLDPGLPPAMADPNQIQQVFFNILNNALDAVKPVSGTRRVAVRSRHTGSHIWMIIEDSGSGIPAEQLSRIFDPFYTTKDVGRGTGLGLSISHGIVAEHGGVLSVDSEAGRGTRFIVELPVAPAGLVPPPERVDAQGGTPAGRGHARILVVDDEESIRNVLKRHLTGQGYGVTAASSVDEAVERLRERRYDLLIVDLKMPEKDGKALYEYVENHRPELLPAFILSTGDVMSPEPRKFVESNNIPTLEKPYNLARLNALVRETLYKISRVKNDGV
ncbi:MAG: hypothetical protein A3G34_15660 [Candidatus Lindowbacteria bacterium RIFCSPLOWO2_12_FULL_62_27]|nr:MAG: hypothetical protein A3G34_15660 [Candidatus Lindowbacteria bacterium RIFCSPLOWO2_12_FULL_62_27]